MVLSLNSSNGMGSPYQKTGSKDNQAEIVNQTYFPEGASFPPWPNADFTLSVCSYPGLRYPYLWELNSPFPTLFFCTVLAPAAAPVPSDAQNKIVAMPHVPAGYFPWWGLDTGCSPGTSHAPPGRPEAAKPAAGPPSGCSTISASSRQAEALQRQTRLVGPLQGAGQCWPLTRKDREPTLTTQSLVECKAFWGQKQFKKVGVQGGGADCGRERGSRIWAKRVQFLLYLLLKIRPQRRLGLEAILGVIWSSLLFERWGNWGLERGNNSGVHGRVRLSSVASIELS